MAHMHIHTSQHLTRLGELISPLAAWPRAMRLVWSAAPRWTTLWLTLLITQGLLPVVPVYLTRPLVNRIVVAVRTPGNWESVTPVIVLGGLMLGVLALGSLLASIVTWVRAAQAELVRDYISALLHHQSIRVDLTFYESSDYFDELERARAEADSRVVALLENGGSLIQNSITLLAMATLLLSFGIWVPLLLLLGTLPALLVVLYVNQHYHRWWSRVTSERRRVSYYDMILTGSHFAPELRLFNLGPYFQAAYQELRQKLRNERLRLVRLQSLTQISAGLLALVIFAGAMALMGWRTLQGMISLGDLALFYQAFQRGEGTMRALLGSAGQIYGNSLFLGNLFTFLELQPQISDALQPRSAPETLRQGIHFRNVTFAYPGSQRPALYGFDLTIPAGKVVAIVGANGAGKSTLVKLLCRLYDPDEGRIELDGVDVRDLQLKDVRQCISVLFQFPVTYQATAAQNIALGFLSSQPDAAAIEDAARAAGVHETIARLPQGYNTPLGKWFAGGAELSGGEWQRIAMARAFLRQSPILVLDEPTSFMDSWAEADWFERFRSLAKDRTALVITHRFTIAMRADVIHVMDAGRIVESGSHHELLAGAGLYAQSWHSQMQASAEGSAQVIGLKRSTL